MKLNGAMEQFILHWGEMGSRWGVSRSVAQVHALLYLTSEPMHADEITETLSIARSNVSMCLKELQGWRLIELIHVLGDRRDHFIAESDPWEVMFRITEERKRREIDPTLAMLRGLNADAAADAATPAESKRRIRELAEFMETLTTWQEQVRHLPRGTLIKLLKMGARVAGVVQRRRDRRRT